MFAADKRCAVSMTRNYRNHLTNGVSHRTPQRRFKDHREDARPKGRFRDGEWNEGACPRLQEPGREGADGDDPEVHPEGQPGSSWGLPFAGLGCRAQACCPPPPHARGGQSASRLVGGEHTCTPTSAIG